MTLAELLDRAWSARGLPIEYRLGAGAPFPALSPADSEGACDCSGYVAWAFKYSRWQSSFAWLDRLNGGWLNTDGVWEDTQHTTGLWSLAVRSGVRAPKTGDVLVYPSRSYAKYRGLAGRSTGPRIGHIGIVTRIKDGGPRILHCSAGNFAAKRYAIEETDARVFDAVPYTIAATFAGLS